MSHNSESTQQENGIEQIPLQRIQEYVDNNTPILPFDQNGIGDIKNLFNPEEPNGLPDDIKNFPGVYEIVTDEKGREIKILHPLKLLSRFNPKDFWTPERIKRQVWHGIGTLTGLTGVTSKNDPSKVLLVIFVDADSPKTVILLDEFIKRNGLDTRTIVQRSAHGKRHLFFSIAVDPNDKEELELWRKRALLHSTRLFVDNENVIEIKTQSNQATLAPSKHRTEKTLGYVNTSSVYSISEEPPIVYEALIKEIKDRGCIPITPEEHNTRREKEDAAESDKFFQDIKGRREEDRQDFTEAELENGFKIMTGTDEENLRDGRPFGSIYEKGFRQGVVMAVSGSNFFNNISEQYAVKLVEKLAKHNSSSSIDLKKACELARNTYKRGRKGERIVAKTSLIEDFKRVNKDRDGNAARQRFEKLRIALGYKNKNPKGLGRGGDANRVKQADIIVNLARKEVPLFFKNQFREYCAVVKADIENEVIGKRTHYEVVKLDEYAFKSALRHLWIQENIAQNNPAKITIAEDQLNQAIESLKHDADHSGIPPVETHLRVAWKEVEGVYRYDKCDPDWHQIEVKASADGKSGVREITSDVMIKEINEWKASKFDKSKTPIFFRRYDVNEEQDTPDLDFYDNGPEDNIFEEFIQVLTNVAGNKSSERAREQVHHLRTEASLSARKKSLLAKVNTVTKLVPDITHFVTSVLGPNGSMKTSFLRCEKDLVDPIVGWELYSPRMNLKEIVLVFAHSWFVAYDNIGKVSDDFSNFVCSSTTGTSQDFRKLYNDDVMLRVVIKNVVSIACINRVLNADDILRRSLNEGFIDAKDGGYYQEDSDLKAQFKAMKPKILGYIFSTLSKAIEIKRQMKKGYFLGSMASPEKWGEAFAQAMGYPEGEFIKAYEELDTIQQGLKLDYNPLVVVYQRLYYDLFVKEHNNIPESQLSSDEKIQGAAETEARKVGYKEYNYMQINEALLSYTEYEGIKTTGKDSRWPRNNHELKDQTLAIASDLSRSKPFSVVVRKDYKNRNEIKYVIGTNDGLDRYRELYPLTSENEKNGDFTDDYRNHKDAESRKREQEDLKNRDATFYECITVLQQSNGGEKFEIVAKLAAQRNSNADLYLDGQYKIEESRNAQRILKLLLNHPRIEPLRKRPWTLLWIPDDDFTDPFELTDENESTHTQRIEESSIYLTGVSQNEDRFSENNATASEVEKSQTVRTDLQNRKRPVRKIEDCSIHEGSSRNLDASASTTLEAAIAINDNSENKLPKVGDQPSATSTGGIDSITLNSTTPQPAIAIARKSAQEQEQQRATVYDLLQKGKTRKKVAEILRISEGSVDRAIKNRKKHQQEQQHKTEQIVVQQRAKSPQQLQQQQMVPPVKVEPVKVHSSEQLLLPPFEEYIKNLASFDCEWYKSDVKENRDKGCADQIYCFCLIDVHGKREQIHINQFGSDRGAFMNAILDVMERYPLLIGYWIFGDNRILGDLDHIKMNCVGNDLQQRFERMKEWIKFLDVHKIFSNRAIQGSLSGIGISYREESLNAVAIAYLGGSEGKIQGLFGFNIETEPPTKQLEYCLQDAQLCMKLVQKNDYDLMRILYYIGNEVGLDLVETANASGPITWWTSKLGSIKYGKAAGSTAKWMNEHTIKDKTGKKCNPWYAGGHVLEPIPGQHPNVLTFDVSSMYPTMSHIHNISSETICCECCKDDPDARIPTEVMNDINERLKNEGKEPRPWYYWICKFRTGKLGELMKDLIAKKIEFKHQKLKLKEKAVKLLVNSGYGTFGSPYFSFYDVRVSELITGFARYTLGSIRKSLTGKGCKIVYGDTDSLFLSIAECSNGLTRDDIISEAKNKYGVIFELNTTWKILLLTDKQKTYLGLTDKYQVDGTTMLGVRSNKPKYFHDVTNYLSSEQSLKRIIDEGAEAALTHIISYLRSAYKELEDKVRSSNLEFIRSRLAYYESSKKSIHEKLNGWRGDIYNEILKEECRGDEPLAKSKCYEGRVYQIWKVKSTAGFKKENVYSMHPERHLLNLEKYKEELWTGVKDMLLFYGLNKNRIEDLKSELVK